MFGFAFYAFTFAAFFLFFFFFFFTRFLPLAATVHVRYMNSSRNIWPVFREQYIRVLFTDPQILFFINFFIKNGSHGTIYTFKNYFATVISAISFQFQQNKFYPNRPIVLNLLPKKFTYIFLLTYTLNASKINYVYMTKKSILKGK